MRSKHQNSMEEPQIFYDTSPRNFIMFMYVMTGTAAISMASASNSIHVTVAAAGVAAAASASAPKGAVDVNTLVVRLETLETNGSPPRLIEELITVQKPLEVSLLAVLLKFNWEQV